MTPLPRHLLPETAAVYFDGRLVVGGVDMIDLAAEVGTPVFVYDEQHLRARCREALEAWGDGVAYASKAFLCKAMAALAHEEGLHIDVATGGEAWVALKAGVPAERLILHGNNKSREEVEMAVDYGIGGLVVDSLSEIDILSSLEAGKRVRCTLRVSPGIQPDTHSFISTGQLDSKFGVPVETGQALDTLARLLSVGAADVAGVHAHIGSQIFDLSSYTAAAERVLDFLAVARERLGFSAAELSMGGGLGIAYTADQRPPRPADFVHVVADAVNEGCSQRGLELPRLLVEPGRSIAGPAAVAVYTVGAIKEIPGVRTYVSVDGGMGDNIRPKLYGSRYEAFKVGAPEAERTSTVTIAGRYCESTDILVKDVAMPPLATGDLIALPANGAYSLAMSSNYNYNPRPAVVMVRDGTSRLIRRRETYEDLLLTEV